MIAIRDEQLSLMLYKGVALSVSDTEEARQAAAWEGIRPSFHWYGYPHGAVITVTVKVNWQITGYILMDINDSRDAAVLRKLSSWSQTIGVHGRNRKGVVVCKWSLKWSHESAIHLRHIIDAAVDHNNDRELHWTACVRVWNPVDVAEVEPVKPLPKNGRVFSHFSPPSLDLL